MIYGCKVWGLMGKNNKQLERVKLTAIRNFLGLHLKFPITALELEAGWLPIIYIGGRFSYGFLDCAWMKIERMEENRLIKKIVESTWEDMQL